MESEPLVSVLMPTRNRKRYVRDAIKMFLAQDYPRRELVMVEDGEEDCSDLCIPGPPLIWHFRISGTTGAKLNFAALMSSGSACVRFDDDDWQSPNRISTQLAHMRITGKSVVGMSSMIYYREDMTVAHEYTGDAWYASGAGQMYTREWALSHPHPDTTCGEDGEFVRQAYNAGELSTLSGLTCVVARDHDENTSKRWWKSPEWSALMLASDNWRETPVERIAAIVRGA